MALHNSYTNTVLICALALFSFGFCIPVFAQNNLGATPYFVSTQHVSVSTQHVDNFRTGWNNSENELTTSNVNKNTFGLLFSLAVDDQIYAQPLVAGNVSIANGVHNVVYAATVNNSIYAFDGDSGTLYWNKNYTQIGMRAVKNTDMTGACGGNYLDFSGNIGIVGTPVIDNVNKIMYFVARSTNGVTYHQFLHAVNITNGNDVLPPVEITATYYGIGTGAINGILTFDSQKQNQRSALTLSNGIIYITWASHCDWGPYHGWIIGYNASTLQQQIVFNTTPNGGEGGVWESGQGLAVDDSGNLYIATGNGATDQTISGKNFGESAVKLTPNGNKLTVASFFTPYNYVNLNTDDLDFGSLGSLLIPHSNYFFTGCKDGSLFLLNKDVMGGFNSASNNVNQQLSLNNANANEHCQSAYFSTGSSEYVYLWAENDKLRSYPYASGHLSTPTLSNVAGPTGQSGAVLSVSSNASTNGIIWASFANTGDAEHAPSPGILRALDATNITHELWNSNMVAADFVGKYAKFSSPTIANGHVYLSTFTNTLQMYGLKTILGNTKFEQKGFSMYPNPTDTFLNITFDGDLSITITTASGQELISSTISKQGSIDVSAFSRGIYFLKAVSNGEAIVRKFIKN